MEAKTQDNNTFSRVACSKAVFTLFLWFAFIVNLADGDCNIQGGQSFSAFVKELAVNNPSISRIECRDLDLTGTLPKEIGQLQSLTYLGISKNNIFGTIPKQIGKLALLRDLFIDQTNLNGTLPKEIGDMTNLRILNAHRLRTEGPIPSQLGKLTNLEAITLYGSRLTGKIPKQLGQMKSLRDMYMEINHLTGEIPSQLGNMEQLQVLALFQNQLNGTIPKQLGKLKRVFRIDVKKNDLVGTIPSELGECESLQVLAAHFNELTGQLPTQLGQLSKLTNIALWSNQISGTVPSQLATLGKLQQIHLQDNRMGGQVPSDFFQMDSLSTFRIGFNKNITFSCDNSLLSFYGNSIEAIRCANNNIYGELGLYANTLKRDTEAPDTHAVISLKQTTPLSAAIEWRYSGGVSYGNYNSSSMKELVKHCEDFTFPPYMDRHLQAQLLGFEINWNDNRLCAISEEFQESDYFLYNISTFTKPATLYEISIRPFNLFLSNARGKLVFGIQSKTLRVKTAESEPDVPPSNILLTFRTDSSISLEWDEVPITLSNGNIFRYNVRCEECKAKLFTTDTPAITINQLNPARVYRISVSAETSAGEGPALVATYKTCVLHKYAKSSEGTCSLVKPGYFLLPDRSAIACSYYPNGIDQISCSGDDTKAVNDLKLRNGYWRPNINSVADIKACPKPNFCTPTHNDTAKFKETHISDQYCAEYHTGVYCSDCVAGYKLSFSGCIVCDNAAVQEDEQKGITFLIVFILMIFLYQLRSVLSVVLDSERESNMSKTLSILNQKMERIGAFFVRYVSRKLQIFIVTTQILYSFQNLLSTASSGNGETNLFMALVTLELETVVTILDFNCFAEINFYQKLLFTSLFPLAVVVYIFLAYAVQHMVFRDKHKRKILYQNAFALFLTVSIYVYEPVSQTVIQTFLCETIRFSSGEEEYLRADYRIRCDSEKHEAYLIYAAFLVLLYPLGIFLMNMYLLHRRRKSFLLLHNHKKFIKQGLQVSNVDETDIDKVKLLEFLTRPYKDKYYWFEVYELLRRLLMSSVLAIIVVQEDLNGKKYIAEVYAFILVVCSLFALEVTRPYKYKSDWLYALVSLLILSLATQPSLWSKFLIEDENVASNEGKAVFEQEFYSALFWLEMVMFLLFMTLNILMSRLKAKDKAPGSISSFKFSSYSSSNAMAQNIYRQRKLKNYTSTSFGSFKSFSSNRTFQSPEN